MIRTFASVGAFAQQIFQNLRRVRNIAEKPHVYWVFHTFRFSTFCANSRQYCILKCNPLILFTFWGAESPDPDNVEDQRSRYSCQWQQREKVRRRRSAPRRRRRRVAGRRNKSCMMLPAARPAQTFTVALFLRSHRWRRQRPRTHSVLTQAGEPRPSPQRANDQVLEDQLISRSPPGGGLLRTRLNPLPKT